jgi:microcystin-dependent protein
MATPFIGEIVYFGGNFAPRSYATCQGQIMSIAQNTALFSILGTTYGGNGQTTFALPNLQGRAPVGAGQSTTGQTYSLGQAAGSESVTLNQSNLPAHTHAATFTSSSTLSAATAKASLQTPAAGTFLARAVDTGNVGALPQIYAPTGGTGTVALGGLNVAGTVTNALTGNNIPVSTVTPYLALTALIAIQGIFPSRN